MNYLEVKSNLIVFNTAKIVLDFFYILTSFFILYKTTRNYLEGNTLNTYLDLCTFAFLLAFPSLSPLLLHLPPLLVGLHPLILLLLKALSSWQLTTETLRQSTHVSLVQDIPQVKWRTNCKFMQLNKNSNDNNNLCFC